MDDFFTRMWGWADQHPYMFAFLSVFYLGSLRDNTFKALTWMQDWWTKPTTTTTGTNAQK